MKLDLRIVPISGESRLPVELESCVRTHGLLTAHLARATPVAACPAGTPVMVMFRRLRDFTVLLRWKPASVARGYAALGAGTSACTVSAAALTSGGSPLDVLARWISII